jgi:putative DNA primase/helicase
MTRPQGWDIGDAIAEKMDILRFLDTCPRLTTDDEQEDNVLSGLNYGESAATVEAIRILRPIMDEARRRWSLIHLENSLPNEATAAADFAAMFLGSIRYVKGSGWRVYDSDRGVWVRDTEALLVSRLEVFAAEARRPFIGISINPKEAERFVRAMLTRRGIRDVVEIAKSEPALLADRSEFDQDLDAVLDSAGQHIDLRTGTVRPAKPEDRHTKRLSVAFDAAAECPLFKKVLEEAQPDAEDRAYLQREAGYFMTGRTTEQVVFFNDGMGQNSKGTIFHPIESILGDYAVTLPSSYIAPTSKSGKPEVQNARLESIRAAFIRETELGAQLDEGGMKNITGGDPIAAEAKYEAPYSYIPQFKINIETNHPPKIRDRGKGTWRRIRRLPWEVTIPDDRVDTTLGQKLEAEFPGILRWMVEGAADWYAGGLRPPERVNRAGMAYKRATDSLADFLDGYAQGEGLTHPAGELGESYRVWADTQGIRKRLTLGQFKEAMLQRGFTWKHTKTGSFYFGIGPAGVAGDGLPSPSNSPHTRARDELFTESDDIPSPDDGTGVVV